jgi:hypothetical protein
MTRHFNEDANAIVVQARRAARPASVEDLALGIVAVSEGLVPPLLSALGTSGPALSTAILDRYHPAS